MITHASFESVVPVTIKFNDMTVDVEFSVDGHVDYLFPDQSQIHNIEIEKVLINDPELEYHIHEKIRQNMDTIYDALIADIENVAVENFKEPYIITLNEFVNPEE